MIKRKAMRSFMSFFLAMILVISSINLLVSAEGSEDGENVSIGTSGNESETTEDEEEIVEISSFGDLEALAKRVNDGDKMLDILVELKGDIEMTGDWTPIGSSLENTFSGIFDGNGYSIIGVKVKPDVKGGLFGYLEDATVRKLHLEISDAQNSTAGLFYKAMRSTIEEITYNLGLSPIGAKAITFGMQRSTPPLTWGGAATYTWFTAMNAGEYDIETPEDFAGFRNIVNGEVDLTSPTSGVPYNFEGQKVYLTKNISIYNSGTPWHTPIGAVLHNNDDPLPTDVSFNGHFDGKNYEIHGLKYNGSDSFGLFGYAVNGSIANLTIVEPEIAVTAGNSYAGLLLYSGGTSVSNISMVKPRITGSGNSNTTIGGVVGRIIKEAQGSVPERNSATINNCLLYEPYIEVPDSGIGGIVYELNNYASTQNVVYGGYMSGDQVGGLLRDQQGPMDSFAVSNQSLVLGTTFDATYEAMGTIAGGSFYTSSTDNFVSGVKSTPTTSSFFVASDYIPDGFERHFTDSPDSRDFVGRNHFVRENFWDDISDRAEDIDNDNRAYSTTYLTSGKWIPGGADALWVGKANYYPQIKGLVNSPAGHIRNASGLASVALIPEDETEKYTKGVRELHLVKETANGQPIDWDIAPEDITIENRLKLDKYSNPDYEILTYEDSPHLPKFSIVANITSIDEAGDVKAFEKIFEDVQMVDSVLEEIPSERIPQLDEVVSTTQEIKVVFEDPIVENPAALDTVKLYIREMDANGNPVLDSNGDPIEIEEQSVPCIASSKFRIDAPNNAVYISFVLRENVYYKAVLPKGMIKEASDPMQSYEKKNESDEIEVYFSTPPKAGSPIIKLDTTVWTNGNIWEGTTKNYLTNQALLDSFEILESIGGQAIYDKNNTSNLHEYTGQEGITWDVDDPRESMKTILETATGPVAYYYIDNQNIFGTPASTGNARVYIMVKNTDQLTNQLILSVNIVGVPEWGDIRPEPGVHIYWTDDRKLVQDTARQGATATIQREDNTQMPVPVSVVYK